MTYQRNIRALLLQIDQLGGEVGEGLVEAVQVAPDEQARAQDDHRGRRGLVAVRKVGLGELGRHLAGEPADAPEARAQAAAALDLAAGLALRLAGERRGDRPAA